MDSYSRDDDWKPSPEDYVPKKGRTKKMPKLPPDIPPDVEKGYTILENLMKNKNIAWNFIDAVDPVNDCAADYYEVIEKPMWFRKIKDKIVAGEYSKLKDIVMDIRLVFSNCYYYNGVANLVTKRALRLESLLDEQLEALPEEWRKECSLSACYGEDFCSKVDAADTEKLSESYLLRHAVTERARFEKEKKLKEEAEMKIRKEIQETRRQQWEESINCKELKEYLRSAWEVPQIGQFVVLGSATLNFTATTVYELERMLLLPQCSQSLRQLMTTLLSSPFVRPKLNEKPPMPYSYWSMRVTNRVAEWFRIYTKEKQNTLKLLMDYGLDKSFWMELDHKNPLDKKEFHEIPLKYRWIILKGLCDYVMHAHKTVQEAIMNEEEEVLTPRILGQDDTGFEYFYFPQVTGWDVRIYRQKQDVYSPEEDDMWKDVFESRAIEMQEFEARLEAARLRAEEKARQEALRKQKKRRKNVEEPPSKRKKTDPLSVPNTPRSKRLQNQAQQAEVQPSSTPKSKKGEAPADPAKSVASISTPTQKPLVDSRGSQARISARIRDRGGKKRSFYGFEDEQTEEDLPLSEMKKNIKTAVPDEKEDVPLSLVKQSMTKSVQASKKTVEAKAENTPVPDVAVQKAKRGRPRKNPKPEPEKPSDSAGTPIRDEASAVQATGVVKPKPPSHKKKVAAPMQCPRIGSRRSRRNILAEGGFLEEESAEPLTGKVDSDDTKSCDMKTVEEASAVLSAESAEQKPTEVPGLDSNSVEERTESVLVARSAEAGKENCDPKENIDEVSEKVDGFSGDGDATMVVDEQICERKSVELGEVKVDESVPSTLSKHGPSPEVAEVDDEKLNGKKQDSDSDQVDGETSVKGDNIDSISNSNSVELKETLLQDAPINSSEDSSNAVDKVSDVVTESDVLKIAGELDRAKTEIGNGGGEKEDEVPDTVKIVTSTLNGEVGDKIVPIKNGKNVELPVVPAEVKMEGVVELCELDSKTSKTVSDKELWKNSSDTTSEADEKMVIDQHSVNEKDGSKEENREMKGNNVEDLKMEKNENEVDECKECKQANTVEIQGVKEEKKDELEEPEVKNCEVDTKDVKEPVEGSKISMKEKCPIKDHLQITERSPDPSGFELVASGYEELKELVAKMSKRLRNVEKTKTGKLVLKLQSLIKEIEPHLQEVQDEIAQVKEKMYKEYERYLTGEADEEFAKTVWFGKEEIEPPPPVVEVKKKEAFFDPEKPIEEATEVGTYRLRKRRQEEEEYASDSSSESDGPYTHQMRYSTRIATGSIDFKKVQDIASDISTEDEEALEELERNLRESAGIRVARTKRKAEPKFDASFEPEKVAAEISSVLPPKKRMEDARVVLKKEPEVEKKMAEAKVESSTPAAPVKKFPSAIKRIDPKPSSPGPAQLPANVVPDQFYGLKNDLAKLRPEPVVIQRVAILAPRVSGIDLSKNGDSSLSISRLKPRPIASAAERPILPAPEATPPVTYTRTPISKANNQQAVPNGSLLRSAPPTTPGIVSQNSVSVITANRGAAGCLNSSPKIAPTGPSSTKEPLRSEPVILPSSASPIIPAPARPLNPTARPSDPVLRPPTRPESAVRPHNSAVRPGNTAVRPPSSLRTPNPAAIRPANPAAVTGARPAHPAARPLNPATRPSNPAVPATSNSEVRVRIDVDGGVVVENTFEPLKRPIAPPQAGRKTGSSTAQFQPSQWSPLARQRFTSNNAYLNKQLKYKPELPPEPRFLQKQKPIKEEQVTTQGVPEIILPVKYNDGTVVNKKFVGKEAEFILNQLAGMKTTTIQQVASPPALPVKTAPPTENAKLVEQPSSSSDILSQAILNTIEEPRVVQTQSVQVDLSGVMQQAIASGQLRQGVDTTLCVSLGEYGYYSIGIRWTSLGPEVASLEPLILQNG